MSDLRLSRADSGGELAPADDATDDGIFSKADRGGANEATVDADDVAAMKNGARAPPSTGLTTDDTPTTEMRGSGEEGRTRTGGPGAAPVEDGALDEACAVGAKTGLET